jgi:hypothetical protein
VLLAPNVFNPPLYASDHEKAYEEACEHFYPAIEKADEVWVYAPEGLESLGEHTKRDIEFAKKAGKKVMIVKELSVVI